MRTVACVIVYGLVVILLAPVLLVCYLLGLREAMAAAGKMGLKLGGPILGLRLKVSGLERIDPRGTYVYMANHLSFLDGPILFAVIPRLVRVIIKKEIFKIPVVGQGMRFVGFIPVDRKRIKAGKQSIEKAVRLMKERGYSFLIFPEGTRSRDGRIQAFKRGGFFLALESGAAIVPVTIRGTYDLMPKHSRIAKPGPVRIVFHRPVPVQKYGFDRMAALMDRVKDEILSEEQEVGR